MATSDVSTTRSDDTLAAVARDIRDRVSVLANALAVVRLGDGPARDKALRMAERQLDALARLADTLHDPAHVHSAGDC